MFLLLSSSSALFGQGTTGVITTANEDDASTLPLLPPVTWLEKQGITLDEFLQQLYGRVDISVTNAGFVQEIESASATRLQDNTTKPVVIEVRNAGSAQTLDLMPPAPQQLTGSQSTDIVVQQAGAQTTLMVSAVPRFATSLPPDSGIQVKQAGYAREFDLMELAWP